MFCFGLVFNGVIAFSYLAASGVRCGVRDLHCIVCNLSLQCMKLASCVTWVPEHMGSVVAACGLNCSVAMDLSSPSRNQTLRPLHCKVDFNHWTPGSFLEEGLKMREEDRRLKGFISSERCHLLPVTCTYPCFMHMPHISSVTIQLIVSFRSVCCL